MSSLRRLVAFALVAVWLPTAVAGAAPVAGINVSAYADALPAVADGAKQVRFFVPWRNFEPGSADDFTAKGPVRPTPLVSDLKTYVNRIRAQGVTPIMVVLDAPDWAAGGGTDHKRPRSADEFATFLGELAAWLRQDGPAPPVYEVWNEPDAATFWGEAPDPSFYTSMLTRAYPAIKGADPAATVLTGPTTGNNYDWIESLYARGAKGSFDGVSVHTDTACSIVGPDSYYRTPDGRLGQYAFLAYREVRRTMLAHGDDKPIWMSEIGWGTTDKTCSVGEGAGKKPEGVSEADQAAFLTRGFRCMANDPYVVAADWFTYRDAPGNPYGLLRDDGSAKPSLASLAAAGGQGAGECGDFTPPTLDVTAPVDGQTFADKLTLSASATDAGAGVARISYAFDGGQGIRNFSDGLGNGVPVGLAPWQGSGALGLGPHTIEVSALDKLGNTVSKVVRVTKLSAIAAVGGAAVAPRAKLAKKPTCRKRGGAVSCTFAGALRAAAGGPPVGGKVAVQWQWKNKKRHFRKLAGGTRLAAKPFVFKVKLRKKGTWRVRIVYRGVAPYKSYTSKWVTFRVR